MDRAEFEYVYLHANCIAELGFARALVAASADAGREPASASTAPGACASAPVVEDESAVDGVLGFGELTPEQLAEQVARVEAALRGASTEATGVAPLEPEPFAVAIGVGFLDPDWGTPDVGLYLAQAYAARETLQARIDDAFARTDGAAMRAALAALAALAPGLAPLTAEMEAEALEAWLQRYDAGDAALAEVVVQVRRLEPVI